MDWGIIATVIGGVIATLFTWRGIRDKNKTDTRAAELDKLLAVALGVLLLSTFFGTLAGIREDRPLGPHVGGNLTAGLIALYALARPRNPHRHTTPTED